jgi:hypothetical protein
MQSQVNSKPFISRDKQWQSYNHLIDIFRKIYLVPIGMSKRLGEVHTLGKECALSWFWYIDF